ncbi:MAG: TlyA family RNA methyltransferase [Chloroflexi bacterium]|nr:TlyA family RNA methyltransferase [Chloroflexota bacterium]MCL5076011.1 TlyA family RNA methyltransferase [Chloroflexota bacterium]
MSKRRLDVLLVERGLAESREKARALIMAGDVLVEGRVVNKAGFLVSEESPIFVKKRLPYVSRGGLKLAAALERFSLDVRGLVMLDVGASTGGFTDCLLCNGAQRVYAVDVGYGQLDWNLRSDPRVVPLERTNIRYLDSFPEPIDAAVVDVSFISLILVLPQVLKLTKPDAWIIALIKPQFEAGREQVGKGGVVKDPAILRAVLEKICTWAKDQGLSVRGLIPSPLRGPAGNREFLICLAKGDKGVSIDQAIERAIKEAMGHSDL